MSLSLDHRVEGGTLHLVVAGVIDLATRAQLVAALEGALDGPGITGLHIDLSRVRFMDCYGMGALIHGRALADKRSLTFRTSGATGPVRTVMELTGVLEHLGATSA